MKNILMKSILGALVFFNIASISYGIEFVGEGGQAMENRIGQCIITNNTKETEQYKQNGWVTTSTGKCGKDAPEGSICGQGGPEMINDFNFCVFSLSTCFTEKLITQGWHEKRQNETCIDPSTKPSKNLFPVRSVAQIVHFNIDKNSDLNNLHLEEGTLEIANDEVIVSVSQKNQSCSPNFSCNEPIVVIFKAHLIEQDSSCNSNIYKAVTDKTNIDLDNVEIIVEDHAARTCSDFMPFKTEIKVKQKFISRELGKTVEYTHYFGANILKTLR